MIYEGRNNAIEQMNEWGSRHQPFIFFVDYKQQQTYIEKTENINSDEVLYHFNEVTNENDTPQDLDKSKIISGMQWQIFPEDLDRYKQSFDIVEKNILKGNSFLVNLTCSTPIATNLSLRNIYCISKAKYKLWIKDMFVVFSPEIFVRIKGNKISSYPMKGTIDATLPNAEQLLMDDIKESAEHATITDLIRNDLSMISKHVQVTRYRYIDRLETNRGPILQTSSEICGTLPEGFYRHLGDLFFLLLPAGSITGAPKIKTTQIIEGAEHHDRHFYSGVMGYFDGYNLDSAVMIRFVEQLAEGNMVYKSGGGITFQSNVVDEYNEMKQKIYVPIY
jgi:para-aminobenzoate synthetase component 1